MCVHDDEGTSHKCAAPDVGGGDKLAAAARYGDHHYRLHVMVCPSQSLNQFNQG